MVLVKLLRSKWLIAERALQLLLRPILNALCMEVMPVVTGKRRHYIVNLEVTEADRAFSMLIEPCTVYHTRHFRQRHTHRPLVARVLN